MQRSIRAALLAVVLVVSTAVATTPADASVHVTIDGPDVANYWSEIELTGITPVADQKVTVYVRTLTSSTWYRKFATSGADRSYVLSLRLRNDYAYYAVAGGTHSLTHTTTIRRASCSVSGPAFRTFPVTEADHDSFAQFSAVRDGTWAGVAGSELGHFGVIRWQPGHAPVVLARYDYTWGYSFGPRGSVSVVGITPKGSVVASVQGTQDSARRIGVVWTASGDKHVLSADPRWRWVSPKAVADDGTIFGVVAPSWDDVGEPLIIVSWASAASPYHVVARVPLAGGAMGVDAFGDVGYLNGATGQVRLASGERRELFDTAADLGAGRFLYGDGDNELVRWDLGAVPESGPIVGTPVAAWSADVSVGRSGDLVTGEYGSRILRTAGGRYAEVPPDGSRRGWAITTEAIDSSGRVAFTSAVDSLPHFLTCH